MKFINVVLPAANAVDSDSIVVNAGNKEIKFKRITLDIISEGLMYQIYVWGRPEHREKGESKWEQVIATY